MPWEVGTPAEARAALRELQVAPEQPIEVARVEDMVADTTAGPIAVRVFTPERTRPFPVLLWFHGGGWTVGSIEESETTCRSLCRRADYRLAPEHLSSSSTRSSGSRRTAARPTRRTPTATS